MNGEIFDLALRGLWRRRRGEALIFAVLFLSFAFAVVSLNVTGSMAATNEEYMRDAYGEWYLGIPAGQERDGEWLAGQSWLGALGSTVSCGEISASGSLDKSIGTADGGFLSVGRISLQDGRFPETAGEIAMEADLLSALGYGYTIGQEISLTVTVPATAYVTEEGSDAPVRESFPLRVRRTYTLSGVLREYSDLWARSRNSGDVPLNSAIFTRDAAEDLRQAALRLAEELSEAENGVSGVELEELTTQYYMTVRPGAEDEAEKALTQYMGSTRSAADSDTRPCKNSAAYDLNAEWDADDFYARLILAVTLLAVICVYSIRLRDEARKLAVFRSIGITRRQLCLMVLYETILLGVPALLLGTLAGLGLTWVMLKTAVYSGSAPIRVDFPAKLLLTAAALWLLGVALARLLVLSAALRAPLTGRFHLSQKGARTGRVLRGALITALSALLGLAIEYTFMESLGPKTMAETWDSYPDYRVRADEGLIQKGTEAALRNFPGVEYAWGYSELDAGLYFEGMESVPMARAYQASMDELAASLDGLSAQAEERGVPTQGEQSRPEGFMDITLLVVQPGDWVDSIDYVGSGADMEEFMAGKSALVNLNVNETGKLLVPGSPEGFDDCGLEPGDEIVVSLAGGGGVRAEASVRVGGFNRRTKDMPYRTLTSLSTPYAVICSEAFLERLVDAGEPGKLYAGEYRSGEPYGYEKIDVFAGIDADFLTTDAMFAAYTAREGLRLSSHREEYGAYVQQWLQRLILVLAGGVCVILVLAMMVWNALAMEDERERHRNAVLCAIGLSRRQLFWRQTRRALLRGLAAAVLGWCGYLGYLWFGAVMAVRRTIAGGAESVSVADSFKGTVVNLFTNYFSPARGVAALTLIVVVAVTAVSLLAKRRLFKGDLIGRLREE